MSELPKYVDGPNPLETMRQFVETSEQRQADLLNLEKLLRPSSDDIIALPSRSITRTDGANISRLRPACFMDVIKMVSSHYEIDETKLVLSQRGIKNHPRDVALFLTRKEACLRVQEVAREFSISRTAESTAVSRLKKRMQAEA